MVCDRAFVPIQASQFDVWTLDRMETLVVQAQAFNADLRAFVVISRAPTNPSITETEDAQDLLKDFENLSLATSVVRDRIAFRRAAREGLSVVELKPNDPKAVHEIDAFYREVFSE